MYHLLVAVVVVVLQCINLSNAACKMDATTTPPPLPCALCPTLPLTTAPYHPTTINSNGVVTDSINAAGCKQYTVNCFAVGTKYVVVGANEQFIQLSQATPGAKSAVLTCNAQGQIIGNVVPSNMPLTVTSVYCSTQRYNM
uniref:C6 domain-containing protein n=1 Tax=Panagrolaimus sp. ES5 TaxID=591445 RepID=A0AC34FB57_9BILA